jgi:hypothetical protein
MIEGRTAKNRDHRVEQRREIVRLNVRLRARETQG